MAKIGFDTFWDVVRESGLEARPMAERPEEWERVLKASDFAPVSHTRAMIGYQLSYVAHQLAPCMDASLVLYYEKRPVAVWPLSLRRLASGWELGSNEGAVLPPLFIASAGGRIRKTLLGGILGFVEQLCRRYGIPEWKGVESFGGEAGATLWHCRQMEAGAQTHPTHELYVDLSQDLAEIKANLRRSYKSLLTSGLKLWSVNRLYRESGATFEEFRELHQHVAGRVTRHSDTWAEQEKAVREGAAFLIFLRDNAKKMVGGGLFHVSPHEGLYAVGAYDRALFDKPLGHLVQMRAIEEMKAMGLRWYKIGERLYPRDVPAPSQKELSIAHFKEGFATHVFFKLHTVTKCGQPAGEGLQGQ